MQQRQISFWAGKKKKGTLWSACGAVLVQIWLCQQQMLTEGVRHLRDQQQWPLPNTHCRRRTGDEQGQGTRGMLDSDGTGDAGWAPSLLSPSPAHPSLHAIVARSNWEWQGCWDDRAMAPTQPSHCWWQTHTRREQVWGEVLPSQHCPLSWQHSLFSLQVETAWFTTKLVPSCKTLLCCQARAPRNWGCLWANTRVAARYSRDRMPVPAQARPLPDASGPKLLSASWIF